MLKKIISFVRLKTAPVCVIGTCVVLAGCAAVPEGQARHPQDPWEGYNRSMMAINDHIDDAVLRRVFLHPADEVAADKAKAPGNKKIHSDHSDISELSPTIIRLPLGRLSHSLILTFLPIRLSTTFPALTILLSSMMIESSTSVPHI